MRKFEKQTLKEKSQWIKYQSKNLLKEGNEKLIFKVLFTANQNLIWITFLGAQASFAGGPLIL